MDKKTIGLLVCRSNNNVYAQYCLEGYNHPIAITAYEGIQILPDNFHDALPSTEELEAEIVGINEKQDMRIGRKVWHSYFFSLKLAHVAKSSYLCALKSSIKQ